jgi:HEAT repeat protein
VCAVGLVCSGCQSEHERLLREFDTAARAEVRAGALARLAEMNQEEDFHIFLKATHDPSALVRRSAVVGLGRSGDSKAIDPLGELLADPDYDVESDSASGLAKFNTDKARAYLLSAYDRRDGPARASIATALGPQGLKEAIRHEAKTLWDRNQKALEVGGPAERVGAAEEMGRSGRGDAVERLLPMLGDDSVLLAAGAARGLGAAHDKRAVPSLVGVLKENLPVLREAAADALGALGDPAAVPALEKVALEGGSGSAAAVNAIGQLAFAPEGRASLCKLASEGNLAVAALAGRLARTRQGCAPEPILSRLGKGGTDALAALAALEGLGGTAGAEKIAALLDSQDNDVRLAAAKTLAAMDSASEAVGAKVVKLLEAETDRLAAAKQKWVKEKLPAPAASEEDSTPEHGSARTRERAKKLDDMLAKVDALNEARAQALGIKLVDRDRDRGLLDIAEDLSEGDEDLLLPLALAAGRLKVAASLNVLTRLAQDVRPVERAAACEALGGLASAPALEALAMCADDPDRGVLRSTARGLKKAGAVGKDTLLTALKRPSTERWEFVRVVGELKLREAAPRLAELLPLGGSESVEAAVALGRLGDPTFARPLADQLKDRTHPARIDIIEALEALNDPGVVPSLLPELYNERPEVRAAAARALGKLDRAKAATTLEALRFDYYAEVRRAVEEALGAPGHDDKGAR